MQGDHAARNFKHGTGMKYRIAIFASGSGTNAEEIFKYFQNHDSIEVGTLLSNNVNAFALKRADSYGVPTFVFSGKQFRETDEILSFSGRF